jgi:energy-coupling factor transport system ATP-binding protein
VIQVSDVTWQYDQTDEPALRDINLQVDDGELLLVMGASGAGKSTLCKTLNGLIPHSYRGTGTGRVDVLGRTTVGHPTSVLAELVGMVFQDADTQLVAMSVADEIVMGMEHLGVAREEMEMRLSEVAQLLRVENLLDRPPYELSGGQKQRVAVASILAMKPRILILDEPTSELDPVGKAELFDAIRDLNRMGITIILVAHHTEEAAPIADRVIFIEGGRITGEAPPREFFADGHVLDRQGVAVPQVVRLAHRLNLPEIPLRIEEALPLLSGFTFDQVSRDEQVRDLAHPVIEVEGLEHVYSDGNRAVAGVDLTVCEGEMLAIVGQNGSGKTTLAKHLNGLLRPTGGTIKVHGIDIRVQRCPQLSQEVGYVFQNPDFQICTNSVHEEARYGLVNLHLPEEEIGSRAEEALGMVGLSHKESEHPYALSKGERQRLAVASVLAMEPPIIIFDEPTTGQDARQSREIMDLIRQLNRERGKTVIIITHDMAIVAKYCDRVVVLSRGQKIADGHPGDVFLDEEMLRTAFLQAPQITRLARQLGLENVLSVDDLVASARHPQVAAT